MAMPGSVDLKNLNGSLTTMDELLTIAECREEVKFGLFGTNVSRAAELCYFAMYHSLS